MYMGVGKQISRLLMAINVSGNTSSRLFFILNCTTHQQFLVAEVSAIPPTKADCKVGQARLSLQAANGTQIPTLAHIHSLSTLDFVALTTGYLL